MLHCYVEARKPGGLVYLVFASPDGALKAAQALHGRWFAGRSIAVEFLDPNTYAALLPDAAHAIETARAAR